MAVAKERAIQTLEGIRREAAERLVQAETILDAAETDGREMTEEEQADYDRLVGEANDMEQNFTDTQRVTMVSAQRQAISDVRGRFNARPDPGAALSRGAVGKVTQVHITNMRQVWATDPKRGFTGTRDFLLDVMKAAGGMETERLAGLKFRATAGSDEHGGYADPFGGYLIPPAFSPTMLRVEPEEDPTMGRTMMVPMERPILTFPARVDKNHTTSVSGGLRVYRRAETQDVTASRMEMEAITLRANPLMGISYATEELLDDSPISFVALIQAAFQDEFTSRIFNERLNGTGVGEYLGVNLSAALISVTRENATEISYGDILNMMARAWRFRDSVWMASQTTIPQLGQLNLTVGAGGSAIFVQNAAIDMPATLMGRPLFYSEYLQPLGTAGDLMLINWSQYLEGLYQPMRTAESIHVRFLQNERAFRFTMRNDGAPWWRSALTPKNGAATLSPYVRLAA